MRRCGTILSVGSRGMGRWDILGSSICPPPVSMSPLLANFGPCHTQRALVGFSGVPTEGPRNAQAHDITRQDRRAISFLGTRKPGVSPAPSPAQGRADQPASRATQGGDGNGDALCIAPRCSDLERGGFDLSFYCSCLVEGPNVSLGRLPRPSTADNCGPRIWPRTKT